MSERPCIVVTGNHDWVDNFKFHNVRYQYPGTVEVEENNLFHFVIGKTLYISMNFDYYLFNEN